MCHLHSATCHFLQSTMWDLCAWIKDSWLVKRVAVWSSNPTPGHISKHNYNFKRYMHPYVHVSTIAKMLKQPNCPSTDEWIRKMWCMYTKGYFSAIRKNEIMPFTARWVGLEMIILSEVSQKWKDIHHMIAVICGIWNMTQMTLSTETDSQI